MNVLSEWRHGLEHAWQSLADGWNEVRERAAGALIRFRPSPGNGTGNAAAREESMQEQPSSSAERNVLGRRWGFLAADVFDDDHRVVVRLEVPGMRKDDLHIQLQGDTLTVTGEKRQAHETSFGSYRLTQCAYGTFSRVVPLPAPVVADRAVASYSDGVLRVELVKQTPSRVRRIPVTSH